MGAYDEVQDEVLLLLLLLLHQQQRRDHVDTLRTPSHLGRTRRRLHEQHRHVHPVLRVSGQARRTWL